VGTAGDSASQQITVGFGFVKTVGSVTCGTTSLTVPVPAAGVAGGNTLVLRLALRGAGSAAVAASDSQGTAYTTDRDVQNGSLRLAVIRARVGNALTARNSITVTFPSATASGLVVDEYQGIASNPVDASGEGVGSSTASATLSAPTSGDLLVAAVAASGLVGATQPAGWTAASSQSLACSPNASSVGAHRIVGSTGVFTYAPSLSASVNWAAAIVAYKGG